VKAPVLPKVERMPTPIDGLGWGLWIQMYSVPRVWPDELLKVPAALRPEAERYLRGMAQRLRVIRALRGGRPVNPTTWRPSRVDP
jgi:hypothetical protein